MERSMNRRDFLKIAGLTITAGKFLQETGKAEADLANYKEVTCNTGEVITISGQEILVGGLLVSIDPQKNPDKRATVAIACKDDLLLPVQYGPGVWMGRFLTSGDPNIFTDDLDVILAVQSSRNDIPGNCLPQGCTGGSREVGLVAYKNHYGHVLYELGMDRFRPFDGAQLPLPPYLTYLGEVK